MFGGRLKAIIAGQEREILLIERQLVEAKQELAHIRDQLDRVYQAALGTVPSKSINRPQVTQGMSENGLG